MRNLSITRYLFLLIILFESFEAISKSQSLEIDSLKICNSHLSQYEGFNVKAIHINTTFLISSFILNRSKFLSDAQQNIIINNKIGLEINKPFSLIGYSNLGIQLNTNLEILILKETGVGGFWKMSPRLINCDDKNNQIEVEYTWIGWTSYNQSNIKNTFEIPFIYFNKKDSITNFFDKKPFSLSPYLGYNESRGVFLGVKFSHLFDKIKIIDKFDFNSNFSHSSIVLDASFRGTHHSVKSKIFDFTEWRFAYNYSKISADVLTIKESKLLAQFFGTSRPTSLGSTIFRYGTSIEGGNQITNLGQNILPDLTIPESGFGSSKFYIGATSNWERQSFKISYGLQLGNSEKELKVNYIKHIFDAAYRIRFFPADHKPLQIDAQFSSGTLNSISGNIPAGERFFGGNVEKQFISGNSWQIRSSPFIRSFSQNLLNGSDSGFPIGGDNFLSINFTISQTLWHKQLIPKEIVQNQTIIDILEGGIKTNRKALRDFEAEDLSKKTGINFDTLRLYKVSNVKRLSEYLDNPLNSNLKQIGNSIIKEITPIHEIISQKLQDLKTNGKKDSIQFYSEILDIINSIESYTQMSISELDFLDFENETEFYNVKQYEIESIFVGYGNAIPSYITGINNGIHSLRKTFKELGREMEWSNLNIYAKKLLLIQKRVKKVIRKDEIPLAEKAAKPTIVYVGKVLGVLFEELNIASISPFITFDATQLKIKDRMGSDNFYYGLGTGLKISLINFDIYTGYSFNLNKKIGEPTGAFVFTIDILNPF